jgi:rhodanese-related sulfurtransferase
MQIILFIIQEKKKHMSFGQILIYSLILLLVFNFVRKFLLMRNIKQYSQPEAKDKIKNNRAMLLDVRTEGERKSGAIKGSVHIPLNQLRHRSDELLKFKNKEIICYCRSGNRSLSAASVLNKKGLNASSLKGGISRWNFSEK